MEIIEAARSDRLLDQGPILKIFSPKNFAKNWHF
jgi:hypothetical protein